MKTCRACLLQDADEYCSIFKRINQATLDEMFHSLTGLSVDRGDGLPECVCQECYDFIVMCTNFRKKCLKSDKQLRALLLTEDGKEIFQTTYNSEPQGIQETDYYDESPLMVRESQLKINDHDNYHEDDQSSGETEILIEELDVNDEKNIAESIPDHESCYELYDVVEDVDLDEIEMLNECEEDDPQKEIIECVESTHEPQQSAVEAAKRTVETTQYVVECCGCPGMQFLSSEDLNNHSAQVHEQNRIMANLRPYECNICYKRFISLAALSMHQAAPYREKKYGCKTCDASFCSRSALQSHINSVHTRERKYVCDVCQKGFYNSSTMLSHRQIHGEKKFQCSICSKKFVRQSDLLSHQMSHTDERPYGCNECEMRFKFRNHLRDHQTVHTGERTKKCRICGIGFATYGDRRVHELQHDNVHPFKCDRCNKTYGRNYKLQVHIRKVHTKERPFACSDCPERFFQRWEMLAHRRVDHGKMVGMENIEVPPE